MSRRKVPIREIFRVTPRKAGPSFSSSNEYQKAIFLFVDVTGYKSFPMARAFSHGKFTTFAEGYRQRAIRSNISARIMAANNASRGKVLSHCSRCPVACFRMRLRCIQPHDDSMTNRFRPHETDENKGIARSMYRTNGFRWEIEDSLSLRRLLRARRIIFTVITRASTNPLR